MQATQDQFARAGENNPRLRKMPRPEALKRIKDLEDPDYGGYRETYELAVRAMLTYPRDKEIQGKGCWAMALAAITHTRQVMRAGGIEVVVAAMQTYPLDERLQTEGCEMLRIECSHSKEAQRRVMA